MNLELLSSVLPRGLYKDTAGRPYLNDGIRNWPLIVDTSQITDMICNGAVAANDEECMATLQNMSDYLLTQDNHEDSKFDKMAVGLIHKWFTDNLHYIEDHVLYEIVSEMRPSNIFGVVKYNPRSGMDTVKIFIMNDNSTRMYAHKMPAETKDNVKMFRFFEEDFWALVKEDFNHQYSIFGGWNVSRKRYGEFRKIYHVGDVRVEHLNRNPSRIPEKDWLGRNDVNMSRVTLDPIEEVLANYDVRDRTETIIDSEGNHIIQPIQLFRYTEDYNLATVISYAFFQKFKIMMKDEDGCTFVSDGELPIEWYIKEDGVRFQRFRGDVWDNKIGAQINGEHVVDLLNMFDEKENVHVEQLNERISELETEVEDMAMAREKENATIQDLRYNLHETSADLEKIIAASSRTIPWKEAFDEELH